MVSRLLSICLLAGVTQGACVDAFRLILAQGSVTKADVVKASEPLPEFCRVEATLKPADDSEIRIEVWMPTRGWNQKFLAVGNDEWGGPIVYSAMAAALAAGYSAAAVETKGDPFVATHAMTPVAKSIIRANYRTNILFSYFNGCGAGGRQALAELLLYPFDYNGVIAGAPAYYKGEVKTPFPRQVQKNINFFFGKGSKLIQYHSASDPRASMDAFNGVRKASGKQSPYSHRVYLAPGTGHCDGTFNVLSALEQWLEHGIQPPPSYW